MTRGECGLPKLWVVSHPVLQQDPEKATFLVSVKECHYIHGFRNSFYSFPSKILSLLV